MKLSTNYLLALASVSDAEKGGKKIQENYHNVIVSGKDRAFGEHCLAEQNEDGILIMTTTKGLNEVASCRRQLGCRKGYTLSRKIVSIDGLQDCRGCSKVIVPEGDDAMIDSLGHGGWLCPHNLARNSFKFKYRMRLSKRFFGRKLNLTETRLTF